MALKLTCGKGTENLDANDKLILERLTKEYSDKIIRHLGKDAELFDIHLKCHQKEGNTKRYSIEIKFISGKHRFETNADEWKLSDAIHKTMKKLMSEIEHKITQEKDDKAAWKKKARVRFFR